MVRLLRSRIVASPIAPSGMALQLVGVAPASGALAVLTAVLGPATASVPIDVLRVVVGASLLIFGIGET